MLVACQIDLWGERWPKMAAQAKAGAGLQGRNKERVSHVLRARASLPVTPETRQRSRRRLRTPGAYRDCEHPGLLKARAVLNGKKELFRNMVFSKTTACSSYVQPWLVAIGGWRLVEIAGWRLAVGGWRRLAAVGNW